MSVDMPDRGRAARVASQISGCVLVAAGTLAAVASFLTWYTAFGGVVLFGDTEETDGWVTFWLGLALAATGVVIAVRHGRRWVCVLAAIDAAVLAMLFRIDEVGVYRSDQPGARVGLGLWLVGVAASIGIAASLSSLATCRSSSRKGRRALLRWSIVARRGS
jgi:hypothetical protein